MDFIKNIYVYSNGNELSDKFAASLKERLASSGFSVCGDDFGSAKPDIIVCIGGDGTFLRFLRAHDFTSVPVAGFNTGHLGFFQEFVPIEAGEFVNIIKSGQYSIQKHRLLEASVFADGKKDKYKALNEIVVKGSKSTLVHLNLRFGSSFIERFSGDGILFSTPAGSTSYNYSLRGAIADPGVDALQITPIAPMNTSVFRSFASSILLPPSSEVHVYTDDEFPSSGKIVADGFEVDFEELDEVKIAYSNDCINLLRRCNYDFWATVKAKFF